MEKLRNILLPLSLLLLPLLLWRLRPVRYRMNPIERDWNTPEEDKAWKYLRRVRCDCGEESISEQMAEREDT